MYYAVGIVDIIPHFTDLFVDQWLCMGLFTPHHCSHLTAANHLSPPPFTSHHRRSPLTTYLNATSAGKLCIFALLSAWKCALDEARLMDPPNSSIAPCYSHHVPVNISYEYDPNRYSGGNYPGHVFNQGSTQGRLFVLAICDSNGTFGLMCLLIDDAIMHKYMLCFGLAFVPDRQQNMHAGMFNVATYISMYYAVGIVDIISNFTDLFVDQWLCMGLFTPHHCSHLTAAIHLSPLPFTFHHHHSPLTTVVHLSLLTSMLRLQANCVFLLCSMLGSVPWTRPD